MDSSGPYVPPGEYCEGLGEAGGGDGQGPPPEPHALLLPGGVEWGDTMGGGDWGCHLGLATRLLGGVRGHSACRRVGPKSIPKVVVWQQGGRPPTRSEDLASPAT